MAITYGLARLRRALFPRRAPPAPYKLPENAPPWVKAVERVATRYAYPDAPTPRERTRFHYVRTKLLGDPVAKMIADLEGERPGGLGALLDVGTGRGQLPILLLELGRATSVSGFDWDAPKVEDASEAARREPALDAVFHRGDFRDAALAPADTALLVDVLHYVDLPSQDRLLDAVADAVRPGGRVVVREADTERGLRSFITLLEERFFTLVRFNRGERVRFRPAREIAERLERRGFTCEVRPAWGAAPFSNVLIIGRRPG
jgi:SAM-dependent methyltransferase